METKIFTLTNNDLNCVDTKFQDDPLSNYDVTTKTCFYKKRISLAKLWYIWNGNFNL